MYSQTLWELIRNMLEMDSSKRATLCDVSDCLESCSDLQNNNEQSDLHVEKIETELMNMSKRVTDLELKLSNALEEVQLIQRELKIIENENLKLLQENKTLKNELNNQQRQQEQQQASEVGSAGSSYQKIPQGKNSVKSTVRDDQRSDANSKASSPVPKMQRATVVKSTESTVRDDQQTYDNPENVSTSGLPYYTSSRGELSGSSIDQSVDSIGNDNGVTFLRAARKGNLNIIETSLDQGVDIDIKEDDDKTALHFACENGHESVVETLLCRGANTELVTKSEENTGLHLAAKQGQNAVVKMLTKKMSDINRQNKKGKTAVHVAAEFNQTEVCKILCLVGATTELLRDNDGYLPIHIACVKNHLGVLKVLVEGGAKIRSKGPEGWLPLHLACKHNSIQVVEYLLDNGFSVNDQDHLKWTPLHVAFYFSNQEAIDLLTKRGADVDKLTISKKTPCQLADLGRVE